MPTADVARLRFTLSADSSGLKAGVKEATGSLKDMSSETGRAMNAMDGLSPDWKGLKRSARSLRFVGRELGGLFKSGIGDAIGVATAGVGMGPLGAGLAIGAIGMSMAESHQEQLEKDRTKAFQDFRGARSKGIDAGTYRSLAAIAGDDAKFLDDMAGSMKKLQDEGPNASESLRKLGEDIKNLGHFTGVDAEDAKIRENQLFLSGEKRLENAKEPSLSIGEDSHRLSLLREKLKLSDAQMEGMSNRSAFGTYTPVESFQPDYFRKHDKYVEYVKQYEKLMQKDEGSATLRSEFENDPSLKTYREKLDERLKHYGEALKDGGNPILIGRAGREAIDEYNKAQGGQAGFAGMAVAGSEEAYSIIAHARMGAAGLGNDTAKTNAILEKQFPELIDAVKNTKPDWKKADTAI
jgi:hypothetical protein